MPTENPFPLNIASKADSWERTQLLSAVPAENKLLAADFNLIKQALNYLYENLGSGGPSANSYDKESITLGAGVSTIELTDNPLPKMVEIFEVQSYMPEGESLFYTYNNATGEIEFNFTFDIETTLHITKYF